MFSFSNLLTSKPSKINLCSAVALAGTLVLGMAAATQAASTVTSFQGFESSVSGDFWQGASLNRVQSGSGNWYAEISRNTSSGSGGYTYFGGAESTATGSVVQSIDVYIDTNWTKPTGGGNLFKLNMFPVLKDGSGIISQAGEQFLFSFNPGGSIKVVASGLGGYGSKITDITSSGWYTFKETFRKGTDGYIKTDLSAYDADGNLLGTQTRGAGPGQPGWNTGDGGQNSTLGGHGDIWVYPWKDGFASNTLKIDNAAVSILFDKDTDFTLTNPIDGSGSTIKKGTGLLTMNNVYDSGALAVKGGGVDLTDGSITTTRKNYYGLLVTNDGQASLHNTSITATSEGSTGVYLKNNATADLDGVTITSDAASITSDFTQSGKSQSITLRGGTTATDNNGTLLQVNRGATGDPTAGMDGVVNLALSGTGTTASGAITDTDGLVNGVRADGGMTHVSVDSGAAFTGGANIYGDLSVGGGASADITGTDNAIVSDGVAVEVDGTGSSLTTNDTLIKTTGSSIAMRVLNGAHVTLNGGSVINDSDHTAGDRDALYVKGAGSLVQTHGTDIVSWGSGAQSRALSVLAGAEVNLDGGHVKYLGAGEGEAIFAFDSGKITTNNTDITVNNQGVGAYAYSLRSNTNVPTINITGGTILATGHDSIGILSQNDRTIITVDGATVKTQGDKSYGVGAYYGGTLSLTDTNITTEGNDAYGITLNHFDNGLTSGFDAKGAAYLTMSGGSVTTNGDNATGLYIAKGSTAALTDGVAISTTGTGADGVYGKGSGSLFTMHGGSITTTGDDADGVYVRSGAVATIDNSATIKVTGEDSHALTVFGPNTPNTNVQATLNGATLTATGAGGIGIYAHNASNVQANNVDIVIGDAQDPAAGAGGFAVNSTSKSTVTLNGGSITTWGADNVGLDANRGTINATNVTIVTHGDGAKVVDAYHPLRTAPDSIITFIGGSVTSFGDNSFGLDAAGANAAVHAKNTTITMNGANSAGMIAKDGGQVLISNSSIKTTGLNSAALQLKDNASAVALDTTMQSTGPSILSNLTRADQSQSILVGSDATGSTLTANNGTLLEVNRTTSGYDGIVNLALSGTGTTASGAITDTGGLVNGVRADGGMTHVSLESGAAFTGDVNIYGDLSVTGAGSDAHVTGGSIVTTGTIAPGLTIDNGGTATLSNTSITTTSRDMDANAALVSGAGSTLTMVDSHLTREAGHDFAGVLRVVNGGQADITGGSIISNSDMDPAPIPDASWSAGAVAIEAKGQGTVVTTHGTTIKANGGYVAFGAPSVSVKVVKGATVKLNGGEVDHLNGDYARGVQVLGLTDASSLTATGTNINISGDHTIAVQSYGSQAAITLNSGLASDGTTVTGNIITSGTQAAGMEAARGASITANGINITTSGQEAVGAMVDRSATLNFNGGSITTTGLGAAGLEISDGAAATLGLGGAGVIIKTTGDSDTANDAYANGITVDSGSILTMTGGSITATGAAGAGIFLSDSNSKATLNNVTISTQGASVALQQDSTAGIFVDKTGQLVMNGGSILTSGQNAYGVYVTAGAQATLGLDSNNNSVNIRTSGAGAHGIAVLGTGSSYTMTSGDITTTGNGAAGVYLSGASAVLDGGVAIHTTGDSIGGSYADGVMAIAGSTLVMHGGQITSEGKGATGLFIDGSTATLDQGVQIKTQGDTNLSAADYSDGVFVQNGGQLTMTGGSIAATGKGTYAVHVKNNATVDLNTVDTHAKGASIFSQFEQAGQSQLITLDSGSQATDNNGTLIAVTRDLAGSDGLVTLNITGEGTVATGNIVNTSDSAKSADNPHGYTTDGLTFHVDAASGAMWAGMWIGPDDENIPDGGSYDASGTTDGNVVGGTDSEITGTDSTINGGVQTGSGSTVNLEGNTVITGNINGIGSVYTFTGGSTTIGGVPGYGNVAGNNSSFTFSTNQPVIIGGGLSGENNTAFNFSRQGTTTIQGDVILNHGSSLSGGSLAHPIFIEGDVTLDPSILGGDIYSSGQLSGVGIFAPGDQVNVGGTVQTPHIGTQSFNTAGTITNSIYIAQVDKSGGSDLIEIRNGDFDISGIALQVGNTDGFIVDHNYTIAKTDDGQVKNQFVTSALDSSFDGTLVTLDPVIYNLNNVQISLSISSNPDRSGYTANQNAALNGAISAAPSGNPTANAILMIPGTDARGAALNQISGELYASTQSIMLADGNMISRMLTQRVWSHLGAGVLPGGEPVAQAGYYQYLPQAAMTANSSAQSKSNGLPIWIQAVGNWYDLDSDGNAAETKAHNAGVFIGGDTKIFDDWHIGAAFGFTSGRVDVDSRNSSSDLDNYTASVYGGHSWALGSEKNSSRINLMFGGAYTYHYVDSKRDVYVPGYQSLEAKYNAGTTQVFGQIGYEVPIGKQLTFEPYAGINWLGLRTSSFQEHGGSAALSSSVENNNVTMFTLGLHGSSDFKIGPVNASVYAGAGWRHSEGDITPNSNVALAGGSSFLVSGVPVARDAAIVSAGLEGDLADNIALGFGYDGQFGGNNMSNGGQVYLRITF